MLGWSDDDLRRASGFRPATPESENLADKVLAIDDDRSLHHLVGKVFEGSEVEVIAAKDGRAGLESVERDRPDVVLLDIRLPDASGLELFRDIQKRDRRLPVVFITADSESETAINAIQLGAFDYLRKPLDLAELKEVVLRAFDTRRLMNIPVAVPIRGDHQTGGDPFVGGSSAMLDVFKSIGRVAGQDVTVLIRGESGTGKELVARAVYQHSRRASQCFMAINCAAIPDNLLESELFGHEKGAFTGADQRRIGKFEQCNGGTLFLDEVGDMSLLVQGKVLRLLQDQRFERVGGNTTLSTDVRLVAATNRNLEQMVEAGEFREDLLYRLNNVTIRLPPLRERESDISLLLEHYVSRFAKILNRPDLEGISPDALELLQRYRWPGNIRELQSVVRYAILHTSGTVIVPDFLPEEVRSGGLGMPDSPVAAPSPETGLPDSELARFVAQRIEHGTTDLYAECLEMMERFLFTRVLQETQGNQSRAADLLGITRGKVRDRIAAFGIIVDKEVHID